MGRRNGSGHHLAASLVASIQLIAAAVVWLAVSWRINAALNAELTAVVVSLSSGAFLANLFSVALLLGENLKQRR